MMFWSEELVSLYPSWQPFPRPPERGRVGERRTRARFSGGSNALGEGGADHPGGVPHHPRPPSSLAKSGSP